MATVSVYLNDDLLEEIRNEMTEKESFSRKINDLLRLGLQKQQKMVEMPMNRAIKLLSTIYEKRYKSLDNNKG